MRKVLQKILIVIAVIAAGAALFFLWQYYPSLKDFRQATNYRFASPADLYYQLHTENWPHYTFLDQNVSEVTLDGHQIRTMEIKTEWGNRYIQAVAVKTTFGKYYKFFDVSYDMLHFGYSVTNSGESSEFTRLAQLKGLQFEDGIAIQLISTERYTDSVGGVAQTIESDMYFWGSPGDGPLYVQLFWVSGKELPDGYHLTCIDDPSFDISYEELLEAFRTAVQLREAS